VGLYFFIRKEGGDKYFLTNELLSSSLGERKGKEFILQRDRGGAGPTATKKGKKTLQLFLRSTGVRGGTSYPREKKRRSKIALYGPKPGKQTESKGGEKRAVSCCGELSGAVLHKEGKKRALPNYLLARGKRYGVETCFRRGKKKMGRDAVRRGPRKGRHWKREQVLSSLGEGGGKVSDHSVEGGEAVFKNPQDSHEERGRYLSGVGKRDNKALLLK